MALTAYANAPDINDEIKDGLPLALLNPTVDGTITLYEITQDLIDGGIPTEVIIGAIAHKFKIDETTAKKVIDNLGNSNVADALRLRTKLSFEEAGILTKDGKLTENAIKKADKISLKENGIEVSIKNPEIVKELTKDGSKIEDWAKYKTDSVKMPNGQSKQIHFYKNEKTGKVDYSTQDYKVKDIINP